MDNTPYDDVYRTLLNDCTELIIPVINELFHKCYNRNERIQFLPDSHFINQQDGNTKEKVTDSCFYIERPDKIRDLYHIECQSTPDGSLSVRFFEYDSQIALDHGHAGEHSLSVTYPVSAAFYLRHTSNTPDSMQLHMHTPGGNLDYGIPIMKLQNYSSEDIFQKNLLFILPFHIFCYEKDFSKYEKDSEQLHHLKTIFLEIRRKLEDLCFKESITEYTKCILIDMTKRVVNSLALNYPNIRREVNDVMGGKVLEHEAKTILRQGLSQGKVSLLLELITKKLKKGIALSEISSQIEQSDDYVEKIYNIIMDCGGIDADQSPMIEQILAL